MYNDIITKKYTRNKIKMGLARPTRLVIQEWMLKNAFLILQLPYYQSILHKCVFQVKKNEKIYLFFVVILWMYSVSSDFQQRVKGKNAKYSVRKEIEITKHL